MAKQGGMKVRGLEGLDKALAAMGRDLGFKALRSGLMAASKPMLLAATISASTTGIKGRDSGAIAAAMGRQVKKASNRVTVLKIGPKNKSKKALAIWNAKNPSKTPAKRLTHFHLVEFGSVHGGAQPFMRPAFDATKAIVVLKFAKEVRKAIERIRRRNAR